MAQKSTQRTAARTEALAACPVEVFPATPYGFARANLAALWYARTAVKDATDQINQAEKADTGVAILTGMMRSTKISTNDFICAKRAVAPFAAPNSHIESASQDQRQHIRTAARAAVAMYQAHIAINERVLNLLKRTMSSKFDPVQFSDEISTLDVERGQRWNDLVAPNVMALMMLVDLRPTDDYGNFITATKSNPGQTRRSTVTKKEKQALIAWANEHFTEFSDGTPEDQLSDAAKTAKLYLKFFDGHLCADEPSDTK